MIIKELKIKNFRSYYGENSFKFSDGLTLILGDNGDGKTTLFEALQWLFNTTIDKPNMDNISEMRKSKLEIDEQDEVSVSMIFDHDGEKSVEKYFTFKRTGEKTFQHNNDLTYRGYEAQGAEREIVNGKHLVDRCYDAFIQRFSMFKGESELNVFDNPMALKELVNKFSDIKKFDALVENAKIFEDKANKAYLKEMKSDEKVSREAAILDTKIQRLSDQIDLKKNDIKEKQTSLEIYSSRLSQLEQSQETSERYKEIQDRLNTQQDKVIKLRGQINMVNYSHALLDKLWVLCAYPSILKEFQHKCSAISKEKRFQEKEFDKQQAATVAKLETIMEMQGALINGATELPWYLPDQETMEEMLNDHICKICGREAPEGSPAYEFMYHKLEEYKAHVEAKIKNEQFKQASESKELFKNEYVEELHNLSIRLSGSAEHNVASIATEIKDRLDLVERLKSDLNKLEDKIQDTTDEKTRLLIQAGNVPESLLESQFKDIKGLYNQRERAKVRLTELNGDLVNLMMQMNMLKTQLDDLNPSSSLVKVMRDVHHVLEEISKAFIKAKSENLRRFLSEMEEKANEYISLLSANDFHGEIHLIQTADESTEIHLYSSNGTELKKPSGSQKTVMYISVLFAISDFTQEKRDEDYPLIFDAATSSFGDSKEEGFYNVIDKLNKQCIIVTKDFITKGKVRMNEIESLTCKVYRIKKADDFNKNNMETIRTIIKEVK